MFLMLSLLLLTLALPVSAAVVWPSGNSAWTAITQGSSGYVEGKDFSQDRSTDIRGSTSLSAGYYYLDDNQYLMMFRIRINSNPQSGGGWDKNVWQVLFDTDGDPTTIDWALQLDQSTPGANNRIEFGTVTHGSPNTWIKLTVDDTTWQSNGKFRSVATGETAFDSSADYFIDMAIPYTVLARNANIAIGDTFTVALATSQQSNNVNKDTPDINASGTTTNPRPNQGPFSDPITFNPAAIPEPSSVILTGAGLVGLFLLRRRLNRGRKVTRQTATEPIPPPPSATA